MTDKICDKCGFNPVEVKFCTVYDPGCSRDPYNIRLPKTEWWGKHKEYRDLSDQNLFNDYVKFLGRLTSHEVVKTLYPVNIDYKTVIKILKLFKYVEGERTYTKDFCELLCKELDVSNEEDKIKWSNLISLIGPNYGWLRRLKLKEFMG